MADEEQPSWLSSSNPASNSAPAATSPTTSKSTNNGVDPPYKSLVKWTFFFLNIGFMLFLAAVGALGVGASNNIDDTGVIFVGIYMILFAAIEFIFEISQVIPWEALDVFIKRNFGFLYGMIGKGMFITFMGVLAFGLSTPRTLAIACGVLVAAWGPLQICVYLKWPDYFDHKEKYNPE